MESYKVQALEGVLLCNHCVAIELAYRLTATQASLRLPLPSDLAEVEGNHKTDLQ